jgi:hypothetical protein
MKGIGKFVQRNGIAMLALFLALGGTTYAASTALIGANTVASPQVVNGSLKAKDLSAKARKALKGNRGATGPQGTTGIQGPKGNAGATNVITRTATVSVPAGGVAAVIAVCNAGEVATGGGALLSGYFNTGPATVVRSYPSLGNSEGNAGGAAPTSWTTRMYNPTGGALNADGYVVCASP